MKKTMTRKTKDEDEMRRTREAPDKLSGEQLVECTREQVLELYRRYQLSAEACRDSLKLIFFNRTRDGLITAITSFGLFLKSIMEDKLKQASYEQLRLLFGALPDMTEYLVAVRVIRGLVIYDRVGRDLANDVMIAISTEYRRLIRKVTLGWYGMKDD